MILDVDRGWIAYPEQLPIKELIPELGRWEDRERNNCSSCVMLRTLSKDLLGVRVYLWSGGSGRSGDPERPYVLGVEHKERGVQEWSAWSRIEVALPKKAQHERLYDLSKHPNLKRAREALIADVEHLLAFYGAVGAH